MPRNSASARASGTHQAGGPRFRPLAQQCRFRSKFGLSLTEALEAFDYLKQRGMEDACNWFTSISAARSPTFATSRKPHRSIARLLRAAPRRAPASNTSTSAAGSASTMTARKPISNRRSTTPCKNTPTTRLPRQERVRRMLGSLPTIISESGRAVVAYHSMLVFDVLGVSNFDRYTVPPEIPADSPQHLSDLFGIYAICPRKTCSSAITTRSRRWTIRSTCSTSAPSLSSSAP